MGIIFEGYKIKPKWKEAEHLAIQANYIFYNGKINLAVS